MKNKFAPIHYFQIVIMIFVVFVMTFLNPTPSAANEDTNTPTLTPTLTPNYTQTFTSAVETVIAGWTQTSSALTASPTVDINATITAAYATGFAAYTQTAAAAITPSLTPSITTTPIATFAFPPLPSSEVELVRLNMLDIAYLYTHHRWSATTTNLLDPPYEYGNESGYLLENDHSTVKQIWNYDYNFFGTLTSVDMLDPDQVSKVDTPSWVSVTQINEGIPYAWGMSSGIIPTVDDISRNPRLQDIHIPISNTGENREFDDTISKKYFAGNTYHARTDSYSTWTTGVDCVGLINNAWQMGTRYGMDSVQLSSRAIKFKALQPGDILMNESDHVMLFEKFDTYDPNLGGEPGVGTSFWVYEAAAGDWRVRYHKYTLAGSPTPDSDDPNTDQVTIDDLSGTYTPRTYFAPVDVVLVIDGSGSMGGQRIHEAREAAKLFVDMMHFGDKISVVTFHDRASFTYPTGPDPSDPNKSLDGTMLTIGDKTAVKQAISGIMAGGGTSIGAGLHKAVLNLNTSGVGSDGQPDPARVIILLSDGVENMAPMYDDVTIPDDVSIYTVGLGLGDEYIDAKRLMQKIAAQHKGIYRDASSEDALKSIYIDLYGAIYHLPIVNSNSETPSTGVTPSVSGTNEPQSFTVDSAMGSMTVSLMWSGSPLTFTLEKPDGSLIDSTIAEAGPNMEFVSGSSYAFYTIRGPQIGEWKFHIDGAAGQAYSTAVSTMDAMTFLVNTQKEKYLTGDPIKITASINDTTSGSLAASPEYIHGAIMQVVVQDPALAETTFDLYDDGLHDDGAADDGVYANIFSDTPLEGSYNFNVKVSGNTNRDGLPFTREDHRSILVIEPAKVTSITRKSINPTNAYRVNFFVNFSKPVTGLDVSDFELTTSGLTGATVSAMNIGHYDGNQYIVSVDTGPTTSSATIRLDLVDDDTIKDLYGIQLGGPGAGNGNFTGGETYDILGHENEIIVTKLADTNDGICDSDCSLREAIATAPIDATISFAPGLSGGTILLTNGTSFIPLRNMTIDGSALAIPITINGDRFGTGNYVEAFRVNSGVNLTLNGLTITKSQGIYLNANSVLTVTNSTLSNNRSGDGGAINNNGTLTVTNTTFSGNFSTSLGGAIFNDDGVATITNSTFLGNSAQSGGGIQNHDGTLTVTNSTFSGNKAAFGGGIDNSGTGNSGTVTVINSTFFGNTATIYGGGLRNSHTTTIINSTLSGNSAGINGGGIRNTGSLHYSNTIVANSISSADCNSSGTIVINTNNLVEDGSCAALLSGDPNLGPLTDNGGLAQTMALLSGSPAINAGDNASCAASPVNNLDQRGVVRPQASFCDIGAFEKYAGAIPNVDAFAMAPYTDSFDIPVTRFLASDDIGVTGYMITETGIAPSSGSDAWLETIPATYHVTEYATYTLYAWAKDAEGHVSPVLNIPSSVIVTPVIAFNISGNAGVEGATLSYTDDTGPKTGTSASDGSYSITVPYSWSGTVSVSKPGYAFTPISKTYVNVTADVNGENYSGSALPTATATQTATSTKTITPTKTTTSMKTLTPTKTATPTTTLTPTKTDTATVTSTPTQTPTPTLTPTLTPTPYNQNTITGNVGVPWAMLHYMDDTPKTIMADGSGDYSLVVSQNWSGTVMPSRMGYTFGPANRTYTNVSSNPVSQDYTPTLIGVISAADTHSCWMKNNGNLACWGENGQGKSTPPGGAFRQVVTGMAHTCGIKNDSTLTCWGHTVSPIPSGTFAQISAGNLHTCGLKSDGTLACWGLNDAPVLTPPGGTFVQVSVGVNFACGIKSDSTLTCWGDNSEGQATPPSGTFREISAGWYHVCAIKTDNTLACWGAGTTITNIGFYEYGQSIPPSGTFKQVTAGHVYTCGLKSDDTLTCWGNHPSGTPDVSFTQISAGRNYICALKSDGAPTCWGDDNDYGQIKPIMISGYVGAGVTMHYVEDGEEKTVNVDELNNDGYFIIEVSYNWSGTIWPVKSGVTFTPVSRAYSNLIADISSQTFSEVSTPTPTVTATPTKTFTPTATPTKTITPTRTPVSITFHSIDTQDGQILESPVTSGTGGTLNNNYGNIAIGDDAGNKQLVGILSFGTASLPDNAIIQSAVLRIRHQAIVGLDPFAEFTHLAVDMKEGAFGTLALELSDFNATADAQAVGAINSTLVNNWYSLSLNATGRGLVNLISGATQFRLRFNPDDNDNNAADYLQVYSGDHATYPPELVITYTLP